MNYRYKNPTIRRLRDELSRLPSRDEKLQRANSAEELLAELEPRSKYSCEYLCSRVAGHPKECTDTRITGRKAGHDLRLLVEDLSDAAGAPADAAGENVVTVDELAEQLHVSTKTIARWRKQGLVSRRFVFDGRKRVGFLQSSVERFVQRNARRVLRGGHFSQLSEEERDQIIGEARRLALAGESRSQAIKRLAETTGRSAETIRYTLKRFDEEHAERAVFPEDGTLREETKETIYRRRRQGESIEALAKRYAIPKGRVRRVVGEVRFRRIEELPLDYIPNEQFPRVRSGSKTEAAILGEKPAPEYPVRKVRRPSGLPPYLASLYEVPLLTRDQEAHLFRKMNYLKYKAARLREQLDPKRPRMGLMDEIERLYEQAVAVKNEIIQANLRLVVSIAKRHAGQPEGFFDLVSDGNMSLMRAAEKFDFARGNKFSTYASWAIMKNFARTIPNELRHRDRYRTSHDEMFGATEDHRTDQQAQESAQTHREVQIAKILARLDPREQEIIARRFGLGRGQEPLTLKEVGAEMGVTKERIRQIEGRAISKLRAAAQDENLEPLGIG